MYGGITSPSEAATIGGVIALLVSGSQLSLTLQNLILASLGAVWTVSIIRLIVWGAYSLSIIMGYIGVPWILAGQNGTLGLAPIALIMLLLSLYAVLGCVLEGMSTIVVTLQITMPLVLAAGFDKIWFGVFVVIVTEMAQITAPVGFNLSVIQVVTGESISRIALAIFTFFLMMVALEMLFTLCREALPICHRSSR